MMRAKFQKGPSTSPPRKIRPVTMSSSPSKADSGREASTSTKKPPKREVCPFALNGSYYESHRSIVYAAAFNPYNYCHSGSPSGRTSKTAKVAAASERPPLYLATIGKNTVSVYECPQGKGLTLLRNFVDPDQKNNYYALAWAYNELQPAAEHRHCLVIGGETGVIRVISPNTGRTYCTLIGHGDAVNELRTSPISPMIVGSASKDFTARLWNINRVECLAVLGGVHGHRDQVLSLDFDQCAHYVATAGMDHEVKLYHIGTGTEAAEAIRQSLPLKTVENSEDSSSNTPANSTPVTSTSTPSVSKRLITPVELHFPVCRSRDLHTNYVDCVRIVGNFIISKSSEETIVIWKFGHFHEGISGVGTTTRAETFVSQLAFLHLPDCDNWFVRMGLHEGKYLACGNQNGDIHMWRIRRQGAPQLPSVESDYLIPHSHSASSSSNSTNVGPTRMVTFSPDGRTMIAVGESGSIRRYDKSAKKESSDEEEEEYDLNEDGIGFGSNGTEEDGDVKNFDSSNCNHKETQKRRSATGSDISQQLMLSEDDEPAKGNTTMFSISPEHVSSPTTRAKKGPLAENK